MAVAKRAKRAKAERAYPESPQTHPRPGRTAGNVVDRSLRSRRIQASRMPDDEIPLHKSIGMDRAYLEGLFINRLVEDRLAAFVGRQRMKAWAKEARVFLADRSSADLRLAMSIIVERMTYGGAGPVPDMRRFLEEAPRASDEAMDLIRTSPVLQMELRDRIAQRIREQSRAKR